MTKVIYCDSKIAKGSLIIVDSCRFQMVILAKFFAKIENRDPWYLNFPKFINK